MRSAPNYLFTAVIILTLGLSAAQVAAQPPVNRGQPGEPPSKHAQHGGKDHRSDRQDRDRYEGRESRSVDLEEAVIRAIFRDERSYIEPSRSLPPGIQKQLARGKPLPPGVAKQFDPRVQSRLPTYPGYNWRQVGTDAVLIDITTGIVEAIIADALR